VPSPAPDLRPDFFAPRGALARVLADYEERPAQRELAQAVTRVLDHGGLLLAEAGTGIGKTFAYLVPAILSGRRVIISTGTRTLQEIEQEYTTRPDKAANILASVELQCDWLREIGYEDVDCYMRIYELAVFGGRKPN